MNFGKDQQCLLNVGGAENSETRRAEIFTGAETASICSAWFPNERRAAVKIQINKGKL